ncbi:MAG: flippase-like domain-containing protein [bacterium]|nr:flippase-like domain-containing protein [bacterium]
MPFTKKTLKYLLGFLVTALALWLSFRNLDWDVLRKSVSQINVLWILLALVNTLFSVYLMGWRWQILLKSKAHIPLTDIFRFNIISQYLNIIIPARFGELLKAWLASRKYRLSGSYMLGTIVIEKIVESFTVVMLGVLAPLFYTFKTELKGYSVAVAIFIILIPMISLVIWKRDTVRKWLVRIAAFFPGKLKIRLLNFLDRGMEAFGLLKSASMSLKIVCITLLVILSQVITNLILFKAFGLNLHFFEALILQLVLIIGMAIPSVPGKIGVFEYTVILGLSMFGVDESTALSYGLMLHVIAYLPKIILGFVFMAGLNISLQTTEAELEQFEGEVKKQ